MGEVKEGNAAKERRRFVYFLEASVASQPLLGFWGLSYSKGRDFRCANIIRVCLDTSLLTSTKTKIRLRNPAKHTKKTQT